MSQSGSRPTFSRSSLTREVRTISRPSALREMFRSRNAMLYFPSAPVEENADDVRGQRGEQHERQRNVHEQPYFEQGPSADIAAQPLQRRGLRFEQAEHLLDR